MAEIVKYMAESLTFVFGTYQTTGAMSVQMVDANTGEPYARLSVNLDAAAMTRLPEGAFFLKDWSENAGIADHLLDQHILVYTTPRRTEVVGQVWTDAVRFTKPEERGDPEQCREEYICAYHA